MGVVISRAQSLFTDTLSKVRYLSHILFRLVMGHKLYIHNTYVTRHVVFRSLGQPSFFLKVSYKDKKGTSMRPHLLGISGRGRRRTPTGTFSPFPVKEGCQCGIPFCLGAQHDGPLSPAASFRL